MPGKRFYRSIAWAVIVLVLCIIPGRNIPEPDFLRWLKADKLAHIFLFGTLSFLLLLDASEKNGRRPTLLLLTIAVAYGGLIEAIQSLPVVQRDADVRDAVANAIGALIGWRLFLRFKRAN
ncbi:MAG: VanZ family protein [Bacteroidota bacterium]